MFKSYAHGGSASGPGSRLWKAGRVALDRDTIVEIAYDALRDRGLGGLTMRRLAQDLGVQPGALYYHVASKQELLAAVGERILAGSAGAAPTDDPVGAAQAIRAALLEVRDSAEIVSFVHAYRPDALPALHGLETIFAARLPSSVARLAAGTLICFVLGFVAEEQNFAELVRANLAGSARDPETSDAAFTFGVRAILEGLEHGDLDRG